MLGERLEPLLPKLPALQREGVVTAEKVEIVERAMAKLSRPGLEAEAVETAEQLLTDYAPALGPADLHRYALRVMDATDPDGPEPIDDQLQQDRRHLELKQRRDGMWLLQGKLSTTVGAQLNAILDPLTKPRSTKIDIDDATREIPDGRPHQPWLHDALDEGVRSGAADGRQASHRWRTGVGGHHHRRRGPARQGRTRRNQRSQPTQLRPVAADRR